MLRLASATDPTWASAALRALPDVLVDHAHCEKKAAGAALRLLFQYPDVDELQRPLAELAREELSHFEAVLDRLAELGIPFERQKPSAYAGRLHAELRGREPDRRLDSLLVAALIEARSCERMTVLADALEGSELDPSHRRLGAFYRGLLASEARHHGVYVALAVAAVGEDETRRRLDALSVVEAEAIAIPTKHTRLHGAPPGTGR